MTSPLLALFTRSLREDTRGRLTYWARGGLAALTLLLTAGTTIGSRWQGAPGLAFFSIVVMLQVVCVTIAGLGFFASAVTEEKEDMTLGLLRMTNLNPLSILLGKSTSRLCSALMLLAVTFPFALLAVALGGVSVTQIVASLLAVGAFLFFLCNLALLASVIAKHTAGATMLTAGGLLIYFCTGGLIAFINLLATTRAWLAEKSPTTEVLADAAAWLNGVSVVARLTETLRTGFAGSLGGWQVASNFALGILCFLAAWAAFGHFCDRATEGTAAGTARRRFFGLSLKRPPRPWRDAIAWKEFHFACGGRPAFVTRCCGYGIVAAVAVISIAAPGWGFLSFGNFGVMILPSIASFAFSIEASVMAARIIGSERREQTLSTLASLPLEMRQLIRSKARGCLLAAAPGLVVSSGAGLTHYTMAGSGQAFLLPTILVQLVTNLFGLLFLALLIAFLSLHLLRGALPLGFLISIGVSIVIQIFTTAIVFAGGGFGGASMMMLTIVSPIVIGVIHLVVSVILYRRGLARLEIVAGES